MNLSQRISLASLSRVRENMGAPLISWDSSVAPRERDMSELLKGLRTQSGIEVEPDDIAVDDQGLLGYEGERVLLYIRDQWYSASRADQEYKFHVCKCGTISNMFRTDRGKRYVATKNTSGVFKVVVRHSSSGDIKEEGMREMNVCKNCLLKLNYRSYRGRRSQKEAVYKNFSLREFFQEYGNTRFTDTPEHDEYSAPSNKYPDDWTEISKYYRQRQEWTCEECGLDLSALDERRWLHTHHINHQRNECEDENLKALCLECHSEKSDHGRLRNSPYYQSFKRKYPSAGTAS